MANKKKLLYRNSIFVFSELNHKLLSLALLALVFALLFVRTLAIEAVRQNPYSRLAFFIVSSVGLAFVLSMFLEYVIRRKNSLLVKHKSSSFKIALLIYLFSFLITVLDIWQARTPYFFILGMAAYGSIIWSKTRFLVLSSLSAIIFLIAVCITLGFGLCLENFIVVFLGIIVAIYISRVVRLNLLSSESQLKKLEKENTELWTLSYKDGLTGIYNRRYMEQAASHLFARAVRYKETLHVLMLDIDHFKKVNDMLGHAVGDTVLNTIAQFLNSAVRTSDTAARYGGEEFIMFMVRCNPEFIQHIANRIREGIASLNFKNVPWQITVSIGIAGLKEGDTMVTLIERADKNLYFSKQQGRNRVSGY